MSVNKNLHSIKWTIATPPVPVTKFEIEMSEDQVNWHVVGTISADNPINKYYFNNPVLGTATEYYRIMAYESDGKKFNSQEAIVKSTDVAKEIKVTPNPADAVITVFSPEEVFSESRRVYVIDVNGKKIIDQPFQKKILDINTSVLPNGYYVVNVVDKRNVFSIQVLIQHKK